MSAATPAFPLWEIYRSEIKPRRFSDLTHAFHSGQPKFPDFPDGTQEALFDFDLGHGFQVHRYTHVGQWGTHVDPPVHFIAGGRALDALPVAEMIRPLVVLDISARAAVDADATPRAEDIAAWENRHGRIPAGAFVALRTDWSQRWPDGAAMANKDAAGIAHYPGWSQEALTLLIEGRGVTAIGHETTDTDPGIATSRGDFSLEAYLLAQDRWQIELMANLAAVPEAGALIVASWPKPHGGSGFPARVFAII